MPDLRCPGSPRCARADGFCSRGRLVRRSCADVGPGPAVIVLQSCLASFFLPGSRARAVDRTAPPSPHRAHDRRYRAFRARRGHHRQAAAGNPALRPTWILCRRGAGHRRGRAGSRHLWAARLRAARDRAQQVRRREPEAEGRRVRARTRRGAGWRRPGDLFRPRRRQDGAGECRFARAHHDRRHLPAGHQGSPRGRDPPQARPPRAAGRPFRPSRGGGHHGPVAQGFDHPGGGPRTDRGPDAREPQQPRLGDPDDPVGGRHPAHRRGAEAEVPDHHRAAQGRHLLRHHQPPGGGEAGGPRWSTP